MKADKETAKENLSQLIANFERESASGRIKEYNEEAAKISFIQPLLKDVLGWDVNNRDEVSPEEKISHGRVDYGLKVDGKIKVFIEAKPPRADLRKHIDQAIRYGYNRKGVPFVLLTDFEELKLFDVTVKPDVRNPLKGLKIDLHWTRYLSQFDKLWLLSREAVVEGDLNKLLVIKPKDRISVDKAILDDLKRWREALAKDIFKNNPGLFHSDDREKDSVYLKEIAQRILDRIIFMRSCEDRGLIHRRSLKEIFEERTETVGMNTMIFLRNEFNHYNIIFDSDLFRPQEWEDQLAVDFKVMRNIILATYNPYQFDVIPLEVLGNIYEQYLGYTIRLTDHQVKYELKPEARKAGGVYYTPEYIVDYIVKNTVGKKLKESSSKKVKKLRILDPACGSGSFLIRAYDEMLNYYKDQKKHRPESKQAKLDIEEEEPRLTIHEKSEILREHIFGVDIDEQAVEVTKLSLMLKMLEGEYGIIPGRAILPMLDKNIKCGNSLIFGDTLELKQYFGDDWYKFKPFNWEEEFPGIMKEEGGFSVVIGNPPYVRQEMLGQFKDYFKKNYKIYHSIADLYAFFIEKGVSLLKRGGIFSYIVANKWIRANYGKPLRLWIKKHCIEEIIDFGDLPVFHGATTYPCILRISKNSPKSAFSATKVKTLDFTKLEDYVCENSYTVIQGSLSDSGWALEDERTNALLEKIKSIGASLGEYAKGKIYRGILTGLNEAFVIDTKTRNRLIAEDPKSAELIKPFLLGRDIKRYEPMRCERFFVLIPRGWTREKMEALSPLSHRDAWRWFQNNYPAVAKHLSPFADAAEKRYDKGEYWWELRACDYYVEFEKPKIIYPNICKRPEFTLDEQKFYTNQKCFIISSAEKYLLSILNSRMTYYLFRKILPKLRGDFYEPSYLYFKDFPIRTIDFSNPSEKKFHDDLVALVDVMLNLNKKIQIARGDEKNQIQRQIEKTDREIDEIVYKLYEITEEEKKIIEEMA